MTEIAYSGPTLTVLEPPSVAPPPLAVTVMVPDPVTPVAKLAVTTLESPGASVPLLWVRVKVFVIHLGKLIAVLEDPRNSHLSPTALAETEPVPANLLCFRWENIAYFGYAHPRDPDKTWYHYDEFEGPYSAVFRRAQLIWTDYARNNPIWSGIQAIALYIFEYGDVIVVYRVAGMWVLWTVDLAFQARLHTSQTDIVRFYRELQKGYIHEDTD